MLEQEDIFKKYVKTITNKINSYYEHYFGHKVYKNFKARCTLIDNAIDGKFANQSSYVADVAPMIIRKDKNETEAFIWKYFENDPIISLKSIGGTPQVNADYMQGTLQSNFVATYFREMCMLRLVDNLSRYGTCACFSQFDSNFMPGGTIITPAGPDSPSPYNYQQNEGKKVVVNKSIHPLNVIQDPMANFQSDSSYIGFLDTWLVSDLIGLENNEMYNQENLKLAIESCKKGQKEQFWYGGQDSEVMDMTRAIIHPLRMWTTLNFDGNEMDTTIYYVEMVHNKVIRCHPAGISQDLIPLQAGTYYPRPDMWMGNANLEFKMAFQNLKNWILNATIESTMKQMDRMILTRRGQLNIADINNRHAMSGIVYTDSTEPLDRLMYPVQFQNTARNDVEWLNRETNQMIQELSPVVNMQNKYNDGGMNNSTLGAAQMQAGIGEVLFSFVMRNVSFFISRIGRVNTDLLQKNLPDLVPYRENERKDQTMLRKTSILGEFAYQTNSTYYTNEKGERVDTANMINMVLNWLATGNPAFNGFNMPEMVNDWVRAWKGSGTDIEKYYTNQPQQAIPPELAMMQRQAAMGQPGNAQPQPAAPMEGIVQ